MLTTFERLAKIMKKETAPANWVEAAFSSIVSAVLPAVTSSDKNKVLTVNTSGKWVAKAPASQLPAVTSADEGKVLTVNSSGEWDAETAGGGGGGVEYFNVTISSTNGTDYTADKTWAEISAALEAKKIIVVNNSYTYHYNILIIPFSDGSALHGTQASIYSGTIEVEVIEIGYSDRTQMMYITVTTASVTANS